MARHQTVDVPREQPFDRSVYACEHDAEYAERQHAPPRQLDQRGSARRFASGILLLLAGLAGLLPLALPFGVAQPSGWAALDYFAGAGGDLASALGIGLVAAAGFVLACLGLAVLLPGIGRRVGGRRTGKVVLAVAAIGTAPAIWLVVASEFRLGGMAIGTYSFLSSGLIGLAGAVPALFGGSRSASPGQSADQRQDQRPARTPWPDGSAGRDRSDVETALGYGPGPAPYPALRSDRQ